MSAAGIAKWTEFTMLLELNPSLVVPEATKVGIRSQMVHLPHIVTGITSGQSSNSLGIYMENHMHRYTVLWQLGFATANRSLQTVKLLHSQLLKGCI